MTARKRLNWEIQERIPCPRYSSDIDKIILAGFIVEITGNLRNHRNSPHVVRWCQLVGFLAKNEFDWLQPLCPDTFTTEELDIIESGLWRYQGIDLNLHALATLNHSINTGFD